MIFFNAVYYEWVIFEFYMQMFYVPYDDLRFFPASHLSFCLFRYNTGNTEYLLVFH